MQQTDCQFGFFHHCPHSSTRPFFAWSVSRVEKPQRHEVFSGEADEVIGLTKMLQPQTVQDFFSVGNHSK